MINWVCEVACLWHRNTLWNCASHTKTWLCPLCCYFFFLIRAPCFFKCLFIYNETFDKVRSRLWFIRDCYSKLHREGKPPVSHVAAPRTPVTPKHLGVVSARFLSALVENIQRSQIYPEWDAEHKARSSTCLLEPRYHGPHPLQLRLIPLTDSYKYCHFSVKGELSIQWSGVRLIGKLAHLGKLIVCLYAIPEMHTFSHVTIFETHVIACYEVLRAVEWNQGFTKHTVRSGAVVKYGWSVCVQMYVYVCIYAGMNICVRMVRVWIYVSSVYTLRGDPFWQSPDFHDLACHNLHQVFSFCLLFNV